MTTHEQRLKVAIEVLGDHAWVKTWVHHQGVAALLDALVARDAKLAVEDDNVHHFLDLVECGYCHEVENSHAVGFYCMVDGEVLKTVYTPRVAFERIVALEKNQRAEHDDGFPYL